MHVRIISSDTFRRVYCAENNPIGSKRWLKTWRNWNLQPHNIASLYNTSLFAKLRFYLIELFTSEQCCNRRQLQSSDSKQPKTRILNKGIKRQTWIKLRFGGVEFIVCMTFEACTTSPHSATWHTKGCHTITEAPYTYGTEEICLPFWDVVGASIKSIPTKYHTLGTTFTGCKNVAGLHFRYISLAPVTTLLKSKDI